MTHKPRHSGGTPGASGPPGRNYPVYKPSPAPPGERGGGGYVAPIVPKIKPKPDTDNKGDSIVPKIKPKPKPKDKDIGKGRKIYVPRRKKSKKSSLLANIYSETPPEVVKKNQFFGQYNIGLDSPVQSLMSDTKEILQNDAFKFDAESFVMNYVPEQLHNTVGASYILAKAVMEQGYIYNVNDANSISLDWKDGVSIQYNLKLGE